MNEKKLLPVWRDELGGPMNYDVEGFTRKFFKGKTKLTKDTKCTGLCPDLKDSMKFFRAKGPFKIKIDGVCCLQIPTQVFLTGETRAFKSLGTVEKIRPNYFPTPHFPLMKSGTTVEFSHDIWMTGEKYMPVKPKKKLIIKK